MPGGHFCTNRRFAHRAEAWKADVNSHRLHHFLENFFPDFVRLRKATSCGKGFEENDLADEPVGIEQEERRESL